MRSRSLTRVLPVLTILLVVNMPAFAQESKPAEPPEAVSPELRDGPETPGKAGRDTLEELRGRMEGARRELQLLEAQAAVKRAEVQRAEAELQVFFLQHPKVSPSDRRTAEETVRSDPEVISLREQIESARHKIDEITRRARSPQDPSRVSAQRNLLSLQQQLNDRAEAIKNARIPHQDRLSPPIEQTLDRLIGELEALKRVLPREP